MDTFKQAVGFDDVEDNLDCDDARGSIYILSEPGSSKEVCVFKEAGGSREGGGSREVETQELPDM